MKEIYIVTGTGRSGTSLTCKLLQNLGLRFPKDCYFGIDAVGGYMESKGVAHAVAMFGFADTIKTDFFICVRLRNFIYNIGIVWLKRALCNCNAVKMVSHIHFLQDIGYTPILLVTQRDTQDIVVSFTKRPKHKKSPHLLKELTEKRKYDNSIYSKVYKHINIKFDMLIKNEINKTDKDIAKLLKLPVNDVYYERNKLLNQKR